MKGLRRVEVDLSGRGGRLCADFVPLGDSDDFVAFPERAEDGVLFRRPESAIDTRDSASLTYVSPGFLRAKLAAGGRFRASQRLVEVERYIRYRNEGPAIDNDLARRDETYTGAGVSRVATACCQESTC